MSTDKGSVAQKEIDVKLFVLGKNTVLHLILVLLFLNAPHSFMRYILPPQLIENIPICTLRSSLFSFSSDLVEFK